MHPKVKEFLEACHTGSPYCRTKFYYIQAWWGYSICFGKDVVCYSGPLAECEAAEQWIIPSLSEKSGVAYCYIAPAVYRAYGIGDLPC